MTNDEGLRSGQRVREHGHRRVLARDRGLHGPPRPIQAVFLFRNFGASTAGTPAGVRSPPSSTTRSSRAWATCACRPYPPGSEPVWHLYELRTGSPERLAEFLRRAGDRDRPPLPAVRGTSVPGVPNRSGISPGALPGGGDTGRGADLASHVPGHDRGQPVHAVVAGVRRLLRLTAMSDGGRVVVLGKGTLAIRVADWFRRSEAYELRTVVPVVPEPAWTDSLLGWSEAAGVEHVPSGDYRDLASEEGDWATDLAVSVFYDRILPDWFIRRCGRILNIHNGPLPRYRGVSPINWALKNEERLHGVTIHEITPGIDDGPIVAQIAVLHLSRGGRGPRRLRASAGVRVDALRGDDADARPHRGRPAGRVAGALLLPRRQRTARRAARVHAGRIPRSVVLVPRRRQRPLA